MELGQIPKVYQDRSGSLEDTLVHNEQGRRAHSWNLGWQFDGAASS